MIKKTIFFSLVLCTLFFYCGYRISGTGKLFPRNIKTIVLPEFENLTTTPQAVEFVTFAVRERFLQRSKLKLVQTRSQADSLLEGTILRFEVKPKREDLIGTTQTYNVKITLAIRFIDLTDNGIIFEQNSLNFSQDYEFNSNDFFAQDREAQEKIANKLASQVVSAILENF